MEIHSVFLETCQSGPKWWTNQMMKTQQECVVAKTLWHLLWIIRDHRHRPHFQPFPWKCFQRNGPCENCGRCGLWFILSRWDFCFWWDTRGFLLLLFVVFWLSWAAQMKLDNGQQMFQRWRDETPTTKTTYTAFLCLRTVNSQGLETLCLQVVRPYVRT